MKQNKFLQQHLGQDLISEYSQKEYPQLNNSVKYLIVFILVMFLLFYRIQGVSTINYNCIYDYAFYKLEDLNKLIINSNHVVGNAFLISTSLLIDIFTLSSSVYWVFIPKSRVVRYPFSMLIFYVVRWIHLYIYTPRYKNNIAIIYRFPEGFYFVNPGFPSLTVSYLRASDFFFSGHCGILTITSCEWYYQKCYKTMAVNIIACIYTGFCLLALRVHYFIDISSGIIISLCIYQVVTSFEGQIDQIAHDTQSWIEKRIYGEYRSK